MNKISGIIAATPRVTSVDLSASPHQRLGTPDFGVPRSGGSVRLESSSLGAYDRLKKANLVEESESFTDRFGPAAEVKIASKMAKDFFDTRVGGNGLGKVEPSNLLNNSDGPDGVEVDGLSDFDIPQNIEKGIEQGMDSAENFANQLPDRGKLVDIKI